MRSLPVPLLLCLLPCLSAVARAQDAGVTPNMRVEYAQVLHVEPVHQTLHAKATEEDCEHPAEASGLTPSKRNCRTVRVDREFQRVVGYDVDYIHRGVRYRSRLPVDPGKRLRIRIIVVPDMPPAEKR